MKKKGLYITYFYLPVLVPRSIVAFKHLENSVHSYDIFCKKVEDREKDDFLKHKKNDIKISYSKNKKDSVLHKFLWSFEAANFFKTNKKEYDFIFTSFQPLYGLLAGLIIKLKNPKLKWISYYSDPPGNVLIQKKSGLSFKRLFLYLEGYFAKKSYKYADILLFTNQYQLEYCLNNNEQYIKKAKVLNHSYMEALYPKEKMSEVEEDSIIISHFGRMYENRNAMNLLKALNMILEQKDCKIKMKFYGKVTDSIKDYIKFNGLESYVFIHDFIPYNESLGEMRRADFLLNIDAFLEEDNVYMTSKLADYLGSKTPIISITPKGITKDIIDKTGNISIENKVKPLKSLINKISNDRFKVDLELKEITNYEANIISKQLDEIINKL